MVVHDLGFIGVAVAPHEANAPLVIDAHTVLALTIAFEPLQSVSRQQCEGSHIRSRVEHVQLSQGLTLDGFESAHDSAAEEALGIRAAERPDHFLTVYCHPVNVKQYG